LEGDFSPFDRCFERVRNHPLEPTKNKARPNVLKVAMRVAYIPNSYRSDTDTYNKTPILSWGKRKKQGSAVLQRIFRSYLASH
jgi:hypothetical protein